MKTLLAILLGAVLAVPSLAAKSETKCSLRYDTGTEITVSGIVETFHFRHGASGNPLSAISLKLDQPFCVDAWGDSSLLLDTLQLLRTDYEHDYNLKVGSRITITGKLEGLHETGWGSTLYRLFYKGGEIKPDCLEPDATVQVRGYVSKIRSNQWFGDADAILLMLEEPFCVWKTGEDENGEPKRSAYLIDVLQLPNQKKYASRSTLTLRGKLSHTGHEIYPGWLLFELKNPAQAKK
jgi:hypothetical protein